MPLELIEDYKFFDVSLVANPPDPFCVIKWPLKETCEKIFQQKCEEFIKNKLSKLTKYEWMNNGN